MKRWADILRILVVVSAFCGFPSAGLGQPVSLIPDADTTIYEEDALSNGGGGHLFAGMTVGGDARRALLRFDLTGSFPSGSLVQFASLELTVDRTISPPSTLRLHRLTRSWGEGSAVGSMGEGGGAPAAGGDATWDDRFHPNDPWASPGGDYVATPSASITASGLGSIAFGGPGVLADVQSWIDDPSSNHGWIVIGDESSSPPTAKRFGSRQTSEQQNRPLLTVAFAPPPIPTLDPVALLLCGLAMATIGLWLARRS